MICPTRGEGGGGVVTGAIVRVVSADEEILFCTCIV
jgi:hypothetical protein